MHRKTETDTLLHFEYEFHKIPLKDFPVFSVPNCSSLHLILSQSGTIIPYNLSQTLPFVFQFKELLCLLCVLFGTIRRTKNCAAAHPRTTAQFLCFSFFVKSTHARLRLPCALLCPKGCAREAGFKTLSVPLAVLQPFKALLFPSHTPVFQAARTYSSCSSPHPAD